MRPTSPKLLPALLLLPLLAAGCRKPATEPAAAHPPSTATAAGPWQNHWADGAVFYEIFVRSFADSDGDGNGDLPGLTAQLDYLNDGDPATGDDLGVDGLWLMPVFRSPSYHGYDTTDYEAINPDYGTEADFRRLLDEAHRRGMRVIVDLMVNHTSDKHPWFVESASSPASPRRDWYVWRRDDPGWVQPFGGHYPVWHEKGGWYYYGIFWSGMPDLNFRTPAVRTEVESITAFWLARGVDGFRLDAARHIIADGPGEQQNDTPETHAWWRELAASVRGRHPEALLVGENWTDTATIATYYGSTTKVPGGDELPMSFNFPLAAAVVEAVGGSDPGPVAKTLGDMAASYPKGVLDAPFLTNHDMVRLATQLGKDRARLGNAAAVLLTLPGTPFLYYGEEVGLENGRGSGDEAKRTPMPWDATPGGGFTAGEPWYPFAAGRLAANVAAQRSDPGSLLVRYRELIRLRHAEPALALGGIEVLPAGAGSPVLAFLRTASGGERVLVAHNLGDAAARGGPWQLAAGQAEALFADRGASAGSGSDGAWSVELPPRGSGVWRLSGGG